MKSFKIIFLFIVLQILLPTRSYCIVLPIEQKAAKQIPPKTPSEVKNRNVFDIARDIADWVFGSYLLYKGISLLTILSGGSASTTASMSILSIFIGIFAAVGIMAILMGVGLFLDFFIRRSRRKQREKSSENRYREKF